MLVDAAVPFCAHGRERPSRSKKKVEFVLSRARLGLCLKSTDAVVGEETRLDGSLRSRLPGHLRLRPVGVKPRRGHWRRVRVISEY